eukprot:PITA_24502
MGHYATNLPSKMSNKGSSEGLEGEALASQFEMDFTLIECMASSMMGCVWYLHSGASFHMTSDKKLFSALEEKDLKMGIEMGDDERYSVSGVGTIAFQREHGAPLTLTDVMYVPGLKKNLVSVAMLEDKGYDVVFNKGKAFLRHIAMGQTKRIGIRVKNLYKLEVDDCAALSTKEELVQSQDIGELWHRQLGHLLHGALKIMHQISTGLPKGVETSTQVESSRDGRKCAREDDRLLEDVRENVGAPSSQCRQRESPERYTRYVALVRECVETEPSSFEEAMQQPIWVDAMLEEYDSIVRNSVRDVVPRLENKSVVSSHWLYKVKQVTDGSVEKHKERFVSRGFSQAKSIMLL